MIEYPSIINSSKAPREPCIAFNKLDGSNIRVKYTHKQGFCLFGSRHQLFDETHPFLAGAIPYFREHYEPKLDDIFSKKKLFGTVKEVIVFGEYFGNNSFAGFHEADDDTKKFVMFDILLNFKDRVEFLPPQHFVEYFLGEVEIPNVVYDGNLNESFIKRVREGNLGKEVVEGVICKGTKTKGSYVGKVWMCKIKTNAYINKLKHRYGAEWTKYAE